MDCGRPSGSHRVIIVNPDTAVSDINVPLMLRKGVNHLYMGVYVEALDDVTIAPGDAITID